MCTNTKKLWTIAFSALEIINTNYSHLGREAGRLPVHLTSVPPVAVTVLFILCFFLYALCSHVDTYRRLRCPSRIESIHHDHFKQLAFQCALNSLSLSLLSWFPCVWRAAQSTLAHSGTHQHPRDRRPRPQPVFPGCTAAFCAPLAGKSIFVQIILATSPVYSMLKTEQLYVGQSASLVAQSHGWRQCKGCRIPLKDEG